MAEARVQPLPWNLPGNVKPAPLALAALGIKPTVEHCLIVAMPARHQHAAQPLRAQAVFYATEGQRLARSGRPSSAARAPAPARRRPG